MLFSTEFDSPRTSARRLIPAEWYSPACCRIYGDPPAKKAVIAGLSDFECRLLIVREGFLDSRTKQAVREGLLPDL